MQSKVGYANDPVGKILRFLGAADLTTASITLGGGGEKGVFSPLSKQVARGAKFEPRRAQRGGGEGRERDCGQ